MINPITEEDRRKYREEGYHIIPQVIPASLLKDLRREAAKAQEIARRIDGPQAQRISVLGNYSDELDMSVFNAFDEIEGLEEAIRDLLRVLVYRIANHLDIVALRRAGVTATKLYKRIQYGFHIGNTF